MLLLRRATEHNERVRVHLWNEGARSGLGYWSLLSLHPAYNDETLPATRLVEVSGSMEASGSLLDVSGSPAVSQPGSFKKGAGDARRCAEMRGDAPGSPLDVSGSPSGSFNNKGGLGNDSSLTKGGVGSVLGNEDGSEAGGSPHLPHSPHSPHSPHAGMRCERDLPRSPP